ncbi:hypothetical protein [Polynucleobacter necessarius]|uniref:hypothetical protein n=1 Tax=Polynucleobacter necessarius TaxID=576610 RepID=UPI000E0927E2|nr:hypothetical protein [Polynucleobacter necessarius]HAT39669.1 hypothetical protein [Polynucleobacter sp.]
MNSISKPLVFIARILLAAIFISAAFILHNFWAAPADQAYVQNLMLMKNLRIAGGLFLLTVFGAGELSIDSKKVS